MDIKGLLSNKKILVLIIVIIVVIAGAGAALMYKPEAPRTPQPKGVEKTRTEGPFSGWICSPDCNEPSPQYEALIEIDTNGTELVLVSLNVTVTEDDGTHSETDADSDPDTLAFTVGGDKFDVTTSGNEATTVPKDYSGDALMGFNESIRIEIKGKTFGGGKNPTGPIGIIPIPFLVYIDQGAYYEVMVTYTFIEYRSVAGGTQG